MYKKTEINRYRTESDNFRRQVQLELGANPMSTLSEIFRGLNKVFPGVSNTDYKDVVHINQELIENLITEKKVDYGIVYLWSNYLTRGIGYHNTNELLHHLCYLSNISYKRLLEIKEELIEDKWWREVGEVIQITSYRRLTSIHDIRSKATIKIPVQYLSIRKAFLDHVIALTHLKLQNGFRYHYRNMYWNSRCKVSPIDPNQYPSRIDKVGCSIRKVAAHLGVSYKFCWNHLQGVLKKQYNLVETLSDEEFDSKYDKIFFIENPKYSYFRSKGEMKVIVALGSTNNYIDKDHLLQNRKSPLSAPLWGH